MPHDHSPVRASQVGPWLREVTRLQVDRTYRDRRGRYFVEGVRNVVQAIEVGSPIECLIHSDRLLTAPIARRLVRERRREGTPSVSISPEQFRKLSRTAHASGVAAVVRQHWERLGRISPREGLCWIALGQIRSPGNLGTLIRTSDAVGGAGFLLLGGAVDPFDPTVVRASMGALFRQRFVRTGPAALGDWARRHGCRVVAASPDGDEEFQCVDYPEPTVLLLGEERRGLNASQVRMEPRTVRIPMRGRADSLNVAVAGALMLYEILRTRDPSRHD